MNTPGIPGITATTTYDIKDFDELGAHIGRENPFDVAELLAGLSVAVLTIPFLSGPAFVEDMAVVLEVHEDLDAVYWFAAELAARLKPKASVLP